MPPIIGLPGATPAFAPNEEEIRAQRIQELLSAIGAVSQQVEQVAPEPIPGGQNLALALAQALGAFGRGINPAVPYSQPLEQLRERRRQMADRQTLINQRMADLEAQGKRAQAMAELEVIMGDQEADRQQEAVEGERAFRREIAMTEEEGRNARAKLESDTRLAIARLRDSDPKLAQEQMAGLREIKSGALATRRELPQLLEAGEITPQQVREEFAASIEVLGLEPELAANAQDFFDRYIEPILQEFELQSERRSAPRDVGAEQKRFEAGGKAIGGQTLLDLLSNPQTATRPLRR